MFKVLELFMFSISEGDIDPGEPGSAIAKIKPHPNDPEKPALFKE